MKYLSITLLVILFAFSSQAQIAAISGPTVVCGAGSSVTLTDATPGGTWSTRNPYSSYVDPWGTVTNLNYYYFSDTATIVYTVGSSYTTVVVTLVTPPIGGETTGVFGGSYCAGGTGVSVRVVDSWSGYTYNLYNAVGTLVDTVLGVSGYHTSVYFPPVTVAGTYTVTATATGIGCQFLEGTVGVSVNTVPVVFSVTGGGSMCSGGSGIAVGLSNSQSGVSYQLYNGGTVTGSPVAGTGAAITFGLQTIAGNYTVIANPGTACPATMTGSAVVTVLSGHAPAIYSITGGGVYCAFGAPVNVGLSNSQTGVSYQLYRGGTAVGSPLAGTGAAISFGTFTTAGAYTAVANPGTACAAAMLGTATVTTSSGPLPAILTVGGGGSICSGGPGTTVTLPGSSVGFNYTLYRSGVATGIVLHGTGTPLNFGLQTLAGAYTVVATNTTTGCSINMTGSANITVYASPTTYSVTGGGSYCSGGIGVTIGLGGSQSGVNYQLYDGSSTSGSVVSGTGAAISFGYRTAAGIYTVTGANTRCTAGMTGSATVSVNPLPVISGSTYLVAPAHTITLAGSPSGGTWTSSTPSVATISSSSGIVTGVALGSTTVTYAASCVATHTVYVTATGHRGQNLAVTGSTDIVVIPNPNKGTFRVTGATGGNATEEISIMVTDILGRFIYNNKVLSADGVIDTQVQLPGNIVPGVYVLVIRSETLNEVRHIVIEK